MYIPRQFQIKDPQVALQFMKKYAFATVVGTMDHKIHGVHIPLEIEIKEDKLILEGHIAPANPLVRLVRESKEVLAIFSQPHAYVSSSWYDHVNVPTWNYIAVHATGILRELKSDELLNSLHKMVDTYESNRPNRYKITDMSEDMLEAHLAGLVGFEIEVINLEAKHKLSQNRNNNDYNSIIENLSKSEDPLEREIAIAMKDLRPNNLSES